MRCDPLGARVLHCVAELQTPLQQPVQRDWMAYVVGDRVASLGVRGDIFQRDEQLIGELHHAIGLHDIGVLPQLSPRQRASLEVLNQRLVCPLLISLERHHATLFMIVADIDYPHARVTGTAENTVHLKSAANLVSEGICHVNSCNL
jgi:hypothetical protein